MGTRSSFSVIRGVACAGMLWGAWAATAGPMFNSPANINVLREFYFGSLTNLVTATRATHIDGSGNHDGWYNGGSPGTSITTYTLPGLRTVSSFSANYEGWFDSPATLTLEGSANGGGSWTTLTTLNPNPPGTTYLTGSFPATSVNRLRLTQAQTIPWNGGYYNRTKEVQVFMDASAPAQPMYGDYAGAFSFLRDLNTAGKITASLSPNSSLWNTPESASLAQLFDGDTYQLNGVRDSNTADPTQRLYVRLDLDQAYQMNYAMLGSDSVGNQWGAFGNAEVYTYNHGGTPLNPAVLAGTTVADITGQGWILQKAWAADATTGKAFLLPQAGLYNQILLVWDEGGANQSGRLSNFELFAAMPEPGALALLALGAIAFAGRRQRD